MAELDGGEVGACDRRRLPAVALLSLPRGRFPADVVAAALEGLANTGEGPEQSFDLRCLRFFPIGSRRLMLRREASRWTSGLQLPTSFSNLDLARRVPSLGLESPTPTLPMCACLASSSVVVGQ